jgi:hypothetical protein
MTITPWDTVLIGSSGMTAYWKSRPPYRTLRSNTGFPELSMNVPDLSCKSALRFPAQLGGYPMLG